ncbi:NUDIX hydrolase [Pseudonocardia endophytica]|uniref:ADP-ribose pyrophosphatase YjhB (NUDIX family) n=1 Tax=Pseudonocardia endophytica TaxID=401976 RepID=A0A4R1HD90_PSEEN|nr:NUDIX hydrolase [Pseudonocardia endophytica]TCK20014.1 ADP-ribose pyrophosphatase YjhB (NUDIX family) [Pseudonocardia endophytica]
MTIEHDGSGRWVVHGERAIYESRWVSLGLADVSVPSGERYEHHTVTAPPGAMTVAVDDEGEHVLLTWRHRFVPDVWGWEVPAGIVDDGESPIDAAIREMREETGYRPRSIEHMVTFEPMVGAARNAQHVFLARGVEWVGDATELNEGTAEWVALAEVPELVAKGKVVDAGTLVGLLHVLSLGGTT